VRKPWYRGSCGCAPAGGRVKSAAELQEVAVGNINWGRVILGGLAAGVVIDIGEGTLNGFILAQDWAEAMKALGKTGEMSGGQLAALNVWGLVMGIFAVWLYAAIRPRYGAGPGTAACAGTAVWFVHYIMGAGISLIFDIYPTRLVTIGICVGLVEFILAAMIGASLYKEEAAGAAAAGR